MKIALLTDQFPPDEQGGAGIAVYRMARQFANQGNSVCVITVTSSKEQEGSGFYQGLRVYRIYSSYDHRWRAYLSLYNPMTISKTRAILKSEHPDVVHAHNVHLHLSYHSLKVAHDLGIPVFLTAHDCMAITYGKFYSFIDRSQRDIPSSFDYRINAWEEFLRYRFRYFPLRNFFIRRYLRKYLRRIISVSQALQKALETNGISNIETIYNGIDPKEFAVTPDKVEAFKSRYGLQGKRLMFFGGRLSYLKGGMQLIQALPSIIQTLPRSGLVVAGEADGFVNQMLRLGRQLHVADHLVFVGWLRGDDLKAAYASSDVVVTPSICLDVFPVTNLEAMASKKPIVGSCFGGTSEVVVDGETGYIVNPLNVEMLGGKIIDLLSDEDKARRMGESGYKRVQEKSSIHIIVNQTLDLYQRHL